MKRAPDQYEVEQFFLSDDGTFPNSEFPVLHYKNVLALPILFPAAFVKRLFKKNKWSNSWVYGVFEYHHYHSISHEVLACIKGSSALLIGGPRGVEIKINKGDVLVIPAGVAHKNLGKENQLTCVGAYAGGADYDINYGQPGERPQADKNIRGVPLPALDPVFGNKAGIKKFW